MNLPTTWKTRIQRIDASGGSEVPYRQIAQQVKAPRERLQLALEQGLAVTALDGLFLVWPPAHSRRGAAVKEDRDENSDVRYGGVRHPYPEQHGAFRFIVLRTRTLPLLSLEQDRQ